MILHYLQNAAPLLAKLVSSTKCTRTRESNCGILRQNGTVSKAVIDVEDKNCSLNQLFYLDYEERELKTKTHKTGKSGKKKTTDDCPSSPADAPK